MKFYYKIGLALSLFISSLCFSSIASFAEDCNRVLWILLTATEILIK